MISQPAIDALTAAHLGASALRHGWHRLDTTTRDHLLMVVEQQMATVLAELRTGGSPIRLLADADLEAAS